VGCGCGGSDPAAPSAGLTQYRLTYPDGRVQVYLHAEQAQREAVRADAALEIIHL